MYMYIQKGNGVLFNCFCCGMYEELYCDNVVSCIKTLSLCRVATMCVSAPYSELHKPELFNTVVQRIKMWGCYCLQIVVCCGLKRNCGDVFM